MILPSSISTVIVHLVFSSSKGLLFFSRSVCYSSFTLTIVWIATNLTEQFLHSFASACLLIVRGADRVLSIVPGKNGSSKEDDPFWIRPFYLPV